MTPESMKAYYDEENKPFNEWDQKCNEIKLLRDAIKLALSEYANIKWGWDGDCGVNTIMDKLEETLEVK